VSGEFTVEHHAILFAMIAQAAEECCGDAGQDAVREGVRRYGRRRGARMARYAREHGVDTGIQGYILCGELDLASTANRFRVVAKRPHLQVCATQCAWDQAWREADMLEYGKQYCQAIDPSVIEGYSPDFRFEMKGMLSEGDPCCRFHFYDGEIGPFDTLKYLWHKWRLGQKCLRSWAFHTTELFQVMRETLMLELGEDIGESTIRTARKAFEDRYGLKVAEALDGRL